LIPFAALSGGGSPASASTNYAISSLSALTAAAGSYSQFLPHHNEQVMKALRPQGISTSAPILTAPTDPSGLVNQEREDPAQKQSPTHISLQDHVKTTSLRSYFDDYPLYQYPPQLLEAAVFEHQPPSVPIAQPILPPSGALRSSIFPFNPNGAERTSHPSYMANVAALTESSLELYMAPSNPPDLRSTLPVSPNENLNLSFPPL
jgi:hypothetical protein